MVKANYLFSMLYYQANLISHPLFCNCLLWSSDNQLLMKCTYQNFPPNTPGHHQYLGNTAMQCSKWLQQPQQISSLPICYKAVCLLCHSCLCLRHWSLLCNIHICSWCKTISSLQWIFSSICDASFSASLFGSRCHDKTTSQKHKAQRWNNHSCV